MDNLDIQGRNSEQGEEEEADEEGARRSNDEAKGSPTGPPPPPLSPLQQRARGGNQASGTAGAGNESESSKIPQPLATISIQDLTSIQLRRTGAKMNATKTFSAPPPRSVSMTNGKLFPRYACTNNLTPLLTDTRGVSEILILLPNNPICNFLHITYSLIFYS